jgi:uroporphyrinogen-III synthase
MRVLITRPEPGAARSAAEITALGLQPITLPLTRIEPTATDTIDAAPFDAVAVTSTNALRHASAELVAGIRHLPCFAVGSVTARTARECGFTEVRQGDGDAAGLARTIIGQNKPGSRIAYLCGRLRRSVFEDELAEAGLAVTPIETYETLPVDYTDHELAARMGGEPIELAVVYSAEAAIALVRLLKSAMLPALTPLPRIVCISARVATVLAAEGLKTVVAAEPTEASMLSALRDISSAEP